MGRCPVVYSIPTPCCAMFGLLRYLANIVQSVQLYSLPGPAVFHCVHYTDRDIEQNMEGVKTWVNYKESTGNEEKETETDNSGADSVINSIESKGEVCKFFLENKCRFGDQCRNIHEGEPRQKVSMKNKRYERKSDETRYEKNMKKPPMKTADDVIKRLQWDPMLPKVSFLNKSV